MYKITNKEFNQLADYIKSNFGIHLKPEKKALVAGRLSIVLQSLNINNFSDYLKYVMADKSGEAARTFINKITTNHTFFMRERAHFDFLKNNVLPQLLPTIHDKDLRIWSAGCSTGQEAYTIAMIIDELLGTKRFEWDAKLLATDISDQVLSQAKQGIYSDEEVLSLPRRWVLSYFNRVDSDRFEIIERLKNEVIFRQFNLMSNFPFKKKFHIIFCRNVMIYFDEKTKRELIEKFYDSLVPGGLLFIGHSETIDRQYTRFKYVKPAVYLK